MCGGEGGRFFRRRLKEVNGEQKMGKGGKSGGDDGRTIANSQASSASLGNSLVLVFFFNKNDMSFSPLLF